MLARRVVGWSEGETRSCISSVVAKAKAAAAKGSGHARETKGDPRYALSATTIVAWLSITEVEMLEADLRVLVTPSVKKIRTQQRQQTSRLRKGAEPRSIYRGKMRAEATDKAEDLLALLTELGTTKAVAEHLGVPANTVKQRVRRARRYMSSKGLHGPSR